MKTLSSSTFSENPAATSAPYFSTMDSSEHEYAMRYLSQLKRFSFNEQDCILSEISLDHAPGHALLDAAMLANADLIFPKNQLSPLELMTLGQEKRATVVALSCQSVETLTSISAFLQAANPAFRVIMVSDKNCTMQPANFAADAFSEAAEQLQVVQL